MMLKGFYFPPVSQNRKTYRRGIQMHVLIVEDDFASRRLMQSFIEPLGSYDIAVDGEEAVVAFNNALENGKPYDLILLDIMMPNIDGLETLKIIRSVEKENQILGNKATKVVMTTALDDSKSIMGAFQAQCEGYLAKPINKSNFIETLQELKLINGKEGSK
jgi:two-component system, chemotaxis family, chemotaxis protein CheY